MLLFLAENHFKYESVEVKSVNCHFQVLAVVSVANLVFDQTVCSVARLL